MKISVVTSIVGSGRDNLIDEQVRDSRLNYIAFTKQQSNLWKIKDPCDRFVEDKMNAKIHKVLIHKYITSDYTVWMDGNIQLKKSPCDLIAKYMTNKDILVLKHQGRQSIRQEVDEILRLKLEYPHIMINQLNDYSNRISSGLYWLCFIIRKNTDKVNRINEAWWSEICRHSSRDQISFPFLVNSDDIAVIDKDEYSNYINVIPHTNQTKTYTTQS
jgi:hypothetical protein